MKTIRKTLKKIPIGVQASFGLFVANLITKGIAYLVTPIFTRLLTPAEYGRVSLYFTWMPIFGYVAMFCLSAGVFNNGMSDYPDKRDEYSFSMLILSNLITIVFSIALFLFYPFIIDFVKLDFSLIVLMCVLFLFQPAYNFWYVRKRYEYKYKSVLLATSISAIFSQTVSILLVVYLNGSKDYLRIFGSEISLIIFYSFFYCLIIRRSNFKLETKYWKAAFLFNLPLLPHYLSTYLLSSSDRIMISYIVNDSATAFYSVAHSIASIALIVWSAINGSLLPFTYEKCKKQEFSKINKVSIYLLAFFAFACLTIILLGPEIIGIMATSQYYEAIAVIPPIIGGVFFQVQYHLYANILFYYKKPKYVMVGSVTSFVVNIILNYFCIRKWGYVAAGYTTIISYGLQALIDFLALKFVIKRKIYNEKAILILSFSVIATILIINLIYDYTLIRYIVLMTIICFAFIFRKKLISIFNFRNKELDANCR